MKPKTYLSVVLLTVLITGIALGAQIKSDLIKVKVIEPKGTIKAKYKDKIKVQIELTQPEETQSPDYILVSLKNKKYTFSDYIAKAVKDSKNKFELELLMPDIDPKEKCDLYATAVYTEVRPGETKANVVRVDSDPIGVQLQ